MTESRCADLTMVPCPCCGGSSFDVLLRPEEVDAEREWLRRFYARRIDGDGDGLKDHVEFTQSEPTYVMSCARCETVVRNPQPTPHELRRRYRSDDYGERTLEQLDASERRFFREKAAMVAPMLPAGARVVEVGSFVGAFLDACREFEWQAVGVDVGEETAAFARRKGHDVLQADLRELDLPSGSRDAVFIWNTFDQVDRPGVLLDACRALLVRGGILVLRLPNGRFEQAAVELRKSHRRADRVMRAQAYNNFLTFPYLVGYGARSLAVMLQAHGFAVRTVLGDTILPLATADTRPFAVREEEQVKRRLMRLCSRVERRTGEIFHPWIDVIAQAL